MTILLQEPEGHKHRRPRASVSSYAFPRDPHPTPQHPQGRGTTASYRTRDDQPCESAHPGAKSGRPGGRARCPDAQTTRQRPPYTGMRHGLPGPGQHHHDSSTRCFHRASHTPHNSAMTRPSLHESRHNHLPHAHSPHPQTSTPTTYPLRASGALTICTELMSVGTWRVPGQPGLAKPPAPQDHDPENENPRTQDTDTSRCA